MEPTKKNIFKPELAWGPKKPNSQERKMKSLLSLNNGVEIPSNLKAADDS